MDRYNATINAMRRAESFDDVSAYYQGAVLVAETPAERDFAGHVADQARGRLHAAGARRPAVLLWHLPKFGGTA